MNQQDDPGAPPHLRNGDAVEAESDGESGRRPSIRRERPKRKSIRRDAPPLPPALVPTENVLDLRLAEELDYARRMLEAMGDALSSDSMVVVRHMTTLQSVDIIGQMLGHIASVVRSSDPAAAVERIGMSDLKARLTRRSID